MPFYTFACPHGHLFERFHALSEFTDTAPCAIHLNCHGTLVITAPLLVTASPEVCYDSPIDGTPITSWAQREEDLKKHNCRPYDPEMKTDYLRRQQESRQELDKAIDQSVEESFAKLPSDKRAQLASEVLEQGADLDFQRSTKTH